MVLRELLARLGIVVDEGSVKKADHAIAEFAEKAKHALEAYGVFKLYEFVKEKFENIAETAAGLEHLAQKTGMTTEALQELRYAAQQGGIDAGELQHGLIHLSKSAFEAATQGGAAGAAFYRLGVEVRGADGKLKPTNVLLGEVADRFKDLPDGPEKAALSLHLFSRAGAELIPLLNGGSAGLAKWGIEARKTGGIMSEALVKQGEALHQTLNRLQMAFNGLTYSVLGPFVKRMTEGKNSLADWIAKHREIISLRIQQVVQSIAFAFDAVTAAVKRFSTAFAIIGGILLAITFPITALIGLFALLFEDILGFMQGRDSVFGRFMFAIDTFIDTIETKLNRLRDAFRNLIPQALLDQIYGNNVNPADPVAQRSFAAGGLGQIAGGAAAVLALTGASPQLQTSLRSASFAPTFVINAARGDAQDIASEVKKTMQDWWDSQVRAWNTP